MSQVEIHRNHAEGWIRKADFDSDVVTVCVNGLEIKRIRCSIDENDPECLRFHFVISSALKRYISGMKSLQFLVGNQALKVVKNDQIIWKSSQVRSMDELSSFVQKGYEFTEEGHLLLPEVASVRKLYEKAQKYKATGCWLQGAASFETCGQMLEALCLPEERPEELNEDSWEENQKIKLLSDSCRVEHESIHALEFPKPFYLKSDTSGSSNLKAQEAELLTGFIASCQQIDEKLDANAIRVIQGVVRAWGICWSGRTGLLKPNNWAEEGGATKRVLIIPDKLKKSKPELMDYRLHHLAHVENTESELLYLSDLDNKQELEQALAFGTPTRIVSGNLIDILPFVDKVYVGSSVLGLEAVLAGKKVVTLDVPFYAGWGLTDDRKMPETPRAFQLSVDQLFEALYVRYPLFLIRKKIDERLVENFVEYLGPRLKTSVADWLNSLPFMSRERVNKQFEETSALVASHSFLRDVLKPFRLATARFTAQAGDCKTAMSMLQRMEERFEMDSDFIKFKAELALMLGDNKTALETAEKALMLLPVRKEYDASFVAACNVKCKALIAQGRGAEAFDFLLRAIELTRTPVWSEGVMSALRAAVDNESTLAKFEALLTPYFSYKGYRSVQALFHCSIAARDLGLYDKSIIAIARRYVIGVGEGVYGYASKVKEVKESFVDEARLALIHLREDLNATNVQFFLISGTLLGAVRENGILGHDKDIDVGIMAGPNIHELAAHLGTTGRFTVMPIKTEKLLRLKHSAGVMIDVFLHWEEDGKIHHEGQKTAWWNTSFNLNEIEFLGERFFIPDNYDLYLTENYGDWRTPNTEFETFCDTPNMYCTQQDELVWYYYRALFDHFVGGKLVQYRKVWAALNQLVVVPQSVRLAYEAGERAIDVHLNGPKKAPPKKVISPKTASAKKAVVTSKSVAAKKPAPPEIDLVSTSGKVKTEKTPLKARKK